jgi:hypothetical protein
MLLLTSSVLLDLHEDAVFRGAHKVIEPRSKDRKSLKFYGIIMQRKSSENDKQDGQLWSEDEPESVSEPQYAFLRLLFLSCALDRNPEGRMDTVGEHVGENVDATT